MTSITKLGRCLAAVAAVLSVAWVCYGQQRGKKEKDFPPPAAETLPAEALKFGVAVQESAPEPVRKWAESLAKGDMRSKPVDPQATMRTVDERYPQSDELVRDVITFLVFYSAYKDEDENYRTLGYRIRDIDRETKEITRELQVVWRNEQNRSASPGQGQSQEARLRQEEFVRKQESLLRDYADERQTKATLMEASRKRVNTYLKLLEVAHRRMRGTDPKVVQGAR